MPDLDCQPVSDMVLIEPHEHRRKRASGLTLPESEEPQLWEGSVVAVGPGLYSSSAARMVPDVKPGDVVLYSPQVPFQKYFGEDDKEYRFVKQQAIIAYRPSSRSQKNG